MKSKKLLATIIEVVLIIVAFIAMTYYTQGKTNPTKVYVYSQNIEDAGTEMDPKLVKEVTVPKSVVNDNFVRNIGEMKGFKTDTKVFAGEYVLKQHLTESGHEDPLQQIDWSANRVVSVPVINVSPSLKKGQTIDLIYRGKGETKKTDESGASDGINDVIYSKVFMQDVVVVGAPGDNLTAEELKNQNQSNDGNKAQEIKVAVSLGQAEEITARAGMGKILIAQRKPGAEKYDTLGYIMGDYAKVFTGHGNAETGSTQIVEDNFQEVKPQQ